MTNLFEYEPSARELAQRGMQQAADHADAVEPRWTDRAFDMLKQYAVENREFMTEDVRVWANANGLAAPPAPQAWGAVTQRASREKLIVVDRYQPTRVPPAHATPRPVWRSKIYGGIDL